MALSWTTDKLGPICRSAEDCALVFDAIQGPDGIDYSVKAYPFNWNANDEALVAQDRLLQAELRAARAGRPGDANPRSDERLVGARVTRRQARADRRADAELRLSRLDHPQRRVRRRVRARYAERQDQGARAVQHVAEHVPRGAVHSGRRLHERQSRRACAAMEQMWDLFSKYDVVLTPQREHVGHEHHRDAVDRRPDRVRHSPVRSRWWWRWGRRRGGRAEAARRWRRRGGAWDSTAARGCARPPPYGSTPDGDVRSSGPSFRTRRTCWSRTPSSRRRTSTRSTSPAEFALDGKPFTSRRLDEAVPYP